MQFDKEQQQRRNQLGQQNRGIQKGLWRMLIGLLVLFALMLLQQRSEVLSHVKEVEPLQINGSSS